MDDIQPVEMFVSMKSCFSIPTGVLWSHQKNISSCLSHAGSLVVSTPRVSRKRFTVCGSKQKTGMVAKNRT